MNCASSWTLLSIAVRVASALGLGPKDSSRGSVYDLQLRRRVWYCIGLLDTQTALDRGTLPLLSSEDFVFPPLNLDDSEMSSAVTRSTPQQGFTDMSLPSMTHEAMVCHMKLCKASVATKGPWGTWNDKVQILAEFEVSVKQRYSVFVDSPNALARLTALVARESLVNMQLLLRRPLYKDELCTVPPWDDFNVMKVATEVLERNLRKTTTSEFAPWSWFYWIKWYALAVVLSELCSDRKRSFDERAFLVAQESFTRYARIIADTDSGMLWKPIAKLMRRVQTLKDSMMREMTDDTPPPSLQMGNQGNMIEQQNYEDVQNFGHMPEDQQMNVEEAGSLNDGTSWFNWDLFLDDINSTDYLDAGDFPL